MLTKKKQDICDAFVSAISPLVKTKGAGIILLHGKHRRKLDHVNVLVTVDDKSDLRVPLSQEARNHGILGSINVKLKDHFPNNDINTVKKFFTDHRDKHLYPYTYDEERGEFCRQR